MRKIPALGVERNPTVGYHKLWYVWDREFNTIFKNYPTDYGKIEKITEEGYERVKTLCNAFGIKMGKSGWGAPIPGRYKNEEYLFDNSIIICHSLENHKNVTALLPKFLLSLVSNTKEKLKETAKKLELPLEEIIEASANK